jgi:hypothetical protein
MTLTATMLSLSSLPVSAIAAVLGIVSHLSYFIHGEHLTNIPRILAFAVLAQCLIFGLLTLLIGFSPLRALITIWLPTAVYLSSVWTSMLIYRVFFHPLRSWPGPFAARLSKFYHVFQIRKLDQYKHLQRMHDQYGDFVRIGQSSVVRMY